MKLAYKNGITSVILRVKIMDSASTTGGAKTGLTFASAGLIIATIADNEATTTRYRASSSEVETVTTLGTFETPTSGKCRFKEVDSTNHPGLYEIHIANARWAVSGARSIIVTVSGASGAAQVDAEVQLGDVPTDVQKVAGTAQTAGDIVDLLNDLDAQIGTGTATVTAPVASSGAVTVYYADDYDNDESRSIEFTDTDGNWPTLTGATVTLNVWSKRAGPILLSVAGSVVVATGANKQVRFEPTSANTDDLQIGDYQFAVVATLTNLRRVTLVADDYHVRGVADT